MVFTACGPKANEKHVVFNTCGPNAHEKHCFQHIWLESLWKNIWFSIHSARKPVKNIVFNSSYSTNHWQGVMSIGGAGSTHLLCNVDNFCNFCINKTLTKVTLNVFWSFVFNRNIYTIFIFHTSIVAIFILHFSQTDTEL